VAQFFLTSDAIVGDHISIIDTAFLTEATALPASGYCGRWSQGRQPTTSIEGPCCPASRPFPICDSGDCLYRGDRTGAAIPCFVPALAVLVAKRLPTGDPVAFAFLGHARHDGSSVLLRGSEPVEDVRACLWQWL